MGIRQHLAAGYGLDVTGLRTSHLYEEIFESSTAFADYLSDVRSYADEHEDSSTRYEVHEKSLQAASFSDCVHFDEEFGLADKMLLVPPSHAKSWHRYDNLLDAFVYESLVDYKDPEFMATQWKEKKGTLYPFISLMRSDSEKPLGVHFYWEPCYLDREDAETHVPGAPISLWFMIKHLKLTPEDQTTELFLKLRPTVYRWFS